MADVHTPEQRRRNMQAIGRADTKPELVLRTRLHALGLRYRKDVGSLPGRPDLVFRRHAGALFVHGCFWHGHNCHLFRLPATRREFWSAKIRANQLRDRQNHAALLALSWRVVNVWECALKGSSRFGADATAAAVRDFLMGRAATEMSVSFAGPMLGSGYCYIPAHDVE